MSKKDILISIAIILCCVGITAVIIYTNKSKEKEIYYPVNKLSPEYSGNIDYLLEASTQHQLTNPRINRRGLMCVNVPVAHEREFPWFTKKLTEEIYYPPRWVFHIIYVGGKTSLDIDQPLLEVSKKIRSSTLSNTEIVIVKPVKISSGTKEILEKRGLNVTIIEQPPQ